MAVERTLVLVKPDGVSRGLAGEIVRRLEARGLVLRAAKLLRVTDALAGEHYAEHREKAFFEDLVAFITSAPRPGRTWSGAARSSRPGSLGGSGRSRRRSCRCSEKCPGRTCWSWGAGRPSGRGRSCGSARARWRSICRRSGSLRRERRCTPR